MATETIRITGLEQTLKLLESLPSEIVSKRGGPVKKALRRAAVVFQKEWRANLQRILDEPNKGDWPPYVSTGIQKKSIIVSRDPRPESHGANERYLVRVRRAKYPARGKEQKQATAGMVAAFLEYGTEQFPAKAPMRKAFDAKKQQAVETFVSECNKDIERVIRKLEKTAKSQRQT